ncbi:AbgT family transporter [Nocardia zapadnayensis]|nr:AbgT family transporter [Brevibacterium sp. CS2]MCX0276448.1 AbgT family transporter [Nocardia zapadnayensis]
MLQNIAIVVGLAFVLIGIVYGRITGSLPRLREVPEAMADGIRSLAPVLVLFFAVAQFLAYFKWTGIGTVIAVSGADVLRASGMPPLVILLLIIGLVSVLNLIVTSGSAMWAILAPVLVPMLMYLSISPETTQLVYRIADSCTNAITPMSAYFVLALGMMQRYRKDAGIGTFMSFTIPLALTMLAVWVALFIIWYVIGLPIGPGIAIR